MANFFQTLETVLKKDKRFVLKDAETLLRNKIYEIAMNMDTIHMANIYEKQIINCFTVVA